MSGIPFANANPIGNGYNENERKRNFYSIFFKYKYNIFFSATDLFEDI